MSTTTLPKYLPSSVRINQVFAKSMKDSGESGFRQAISDDLVAYLSIGALIAMILYSYTL